MRLYNNMHIDYARFIGLLLLRLFVMVLDISHEVTSNDLETHFIMFFHKYTEHNNKIKGAGMVKIAHKFAGHDLLFYF